MSKRKQMMNEKKILKNIKEGRGIGVKEFYSPWINVQDFSSLGRISRIKGWKTGRVHQLMSDLETKYFYWLEGEDTVIDIREQYPLMDRPLVENICRRKNIRQPIDPVSKEPIVLTTDFLITIIENGVEKNIARTLKYSHDLDNKRVIEKFEIERNYWIEKGINWGIVTEKDIPMAIVNNIIWIHKSYYLEDIVDIESGLNKANLTEYVKILINSLYIETNLELKLFELTSSLDRKYNAKTGTFLYLFKYCILNKIIFVDMTKNLTRNPYIKHILERSKY